MAAGQLGLSEYFPCAFPGCSPNELTLPLFRVRFRLGGEGGLQVWVEPLSFSLSCISYLMALENRSHTRSPTLLAALSY